MKLIVFNPGCEGGIPKYGWHQAAALGRFGCKTFVLCDRDQEETASKDIAALGVLAGEQTSRNERALLSRVCYLIRQCLSDQISLFCAIIRYRPDVVFLASYMEYLSPVWVWLQLLAGKFMGVTFVANLHDPVRDFVVGPSWWHNLSVRMAYWPLSAVFIHQRLPEKAVVPRRVVVREVPHGLFEAEHVVLRSRDVVRAEWRVPAHSIVFLSFGFIRDGKNLDLLIRAAIADSRCEKCCSISKQLGAFARYLRSK